MRLVYMVLLMASVHLGKKVMRHHFTCMGFALTNHQMLGRYAVHLNQSIHLVMHLRPQKRVYLEEKQSPEFYLHVYYSKAKYQRVFHNATLTCQERVEQADLAIPIEMPEQQREFQLHLDTRFQSGQGDTFMYLVLTECKDSFFPDYASQLTQNQYDVDVHINPR